MHTYRLLCYIARYQYQ